MYDAVMVFLGTWYLIKSQNIIRILALMAIISFFSDMLFFGMGSLPRIGYYFTIANIAVIPGILNLIQNRFGKKIAFIFLVFCIGYAVKTSLPWMTGIGDDRFGSYKFIFL